MVAQLYICLPDGNEKIFDLRKSQEEMKKMTVLELKNSIQEKMNIKSELRLVHNVETLEDSQSLKDYKIEHLSTIHTLPILPGGF